MAKYQLPKEKGNRGYLFIILIVSIVLLVSAIYMLTKYRQEVVETSQSKAEYYTLLTKDQVVNELNKDIANVRAISEHISTLQNTVDISRYCDSISSKEEFGVIASIRYFSNGKLYDLYDQEYNFSDISIDWHENHHDEIGYIGSFEQTNDNGTMSVSAFYAPVYRNVVVDGVVLYFGRSVIGQYYEHINKNEYSKISCLCTSSGSIVAGGDEIETTNIIATFRDQVGDKAVTDQLSALLQNNESGVIICNFNNTDHIISVQSDDVTKDLSVIELYQVDEIFESSFSFIGSIILIIIMFGVVTIVTIVMLFARQVAMRKQLFKLETTDAYFKCNNRNGFERETDHILSRNPNEKFSIVVASILHYNHLVESYGTGEMDNCLQYVNKALRKVLKIQEAYGHIDGETFVLLIHEASKKDIIERLKLISFVMRQYRSNYRYNLVLKYGVYPIDKGEKLSATTFVDYAFDAMNTVRALDPKLANTNIFFYQDELKKIRVMNDDMELRMESALQNNEFHVFYQPKFNLNTNTQDGAEALVRWYDKVEKVFNPPALFMQLFETNGFIVKLDKYVYKKVCEYINHAMADGRKLFPISVNVSRITAVQPDFVESYTAIKKQYGISNGMIMLEFTESFAYENYQYIGNIINKLHANGFKCSLDDFGQGYSSYSTLKLLSMDEIKLDKLFLEKGLNDTRDNAIFESIIKLAKSLNMKVTQEGCEQKVEVERMRKLGCDVIQGFIYSKPIPESQFTDFCTHTSEHKL